VAGVVAGQKSVQEVNSAVQRMATPIPARLWQRLKQAGLLHAGAVVPGA
jgi:hypothetical protein